MTLDRLLHRLLAAIVRAHELVPIAVFALHMRSQRAVIGRDEFDDVLILRHRAITSEAWTFRVERENFCRRIECA